MGEVQHAQRLQEQADKSRTEHPLQSLEVKFHADEKQQENHPQLADLLDCVCVLNQRGCKKIRANQDSGKNVTENDRQLEPVEKGHGQARGRQHEPEVEDPASDRLSSG